MLLELHVKNLALIEKADVEFGEGLNILTGETGAGKSIIIGSVTMALGGKAPKGSIRPGADYAYIELVFSVTGEEKRKALRELDVEPTEDGLVIISRKLTSARSISRINDETVTMARLSQITGLLLDIHGQHEHQSLLYKSKHLEILDAYVKAATQPVKQTIADRYRIYRSLEEKLRGFDLDAESRIREADFLRFEIEEIETSALKEGEEEELTSVYRRYSHSRRIAECLGAAYEAVEGDWLARALKEVEQASEYDESLGGVRDQLYDADSILRDAGREMSAYLDSMEMDEETFRKTEERLDLIQGTLIGTATEAKIADPKSGKFPGLGKAMTVDAIGVSAGALLGTSTITAFVESAAGVGAGGRTGLTAVTTGVLFLICLFLAPLVSLVPNAATSPVLIIVGALMLGAIRNIDFDDWTEGFPAFLVIVLMPFTYSIANGISAGIIAYPLLKIIAGRAKEVNWIMYVLAILVIIRYVFF